jgi:23S rRNA (guanosine2251-2'-O)-methyltransferase
VEQVKKSDRTPIYALLENIRSLHNVGAIFRTSDAVNLEKLYLCGFTGSPPRNEITKTALGAEEVVPWEHHDDAIKLVKDLKAQGVKVVAVELCEGAFNYADADYDFPVCFVFGHEVEGISDELIEHCDMAVQLPMLGRANSLNVATCYGIIVYDALKKLS